MTWRFAAAKRLSLDPLLMGFYAWLLTVAVPSFAPDAPRASRILSLAALVVLVTAWTIAVRYPSIADWLVAAGYLSLCLVTWLIVGHTRLTANLAELRTLLGAVAWSLFAVAWVRSRHAETLQAATSATEIPNAMTSVSRNSLGGIAHVVLSLILVLAVFLRLGILGGDGRGVLVTAIALGWALWLLGTSGILAERFEHPSRGLGLRLLGDHTIILAVLLTGAGVIMSTLRIPWP